MIITVKHMRKAGYCMSGARKFFIRHGLDWGSFIKNGLDEEFFRRTGDAMALRLIEVARGK